MSKATINTLIVSLITVAGAVGLNHFVPFLTYLADNLDSVWAAGLVVCSFIGGLFQYFRKD